MIAFLRGPWCRKEAEEDAAEKAERAAAVPDPDRPVLHSSDEDSEYEALRRWPLPHAANTYAHAPACASLVTFSVSWRSQGWTPVGRPW